MTLSSPRKPSPTIPDVVSIGRHTRARIAMFWAILFMLGLLVLEGSSAVAVKLLLTSPAQHLLWNPDLATARASWIANAFKMDAELGWPSRSVATSGTRDSNGAKVNPDFSDTHGSCLSAYGDSFIWGDEVPLSDGWIEQLSRRLGCRVANYGVSGYGTDQAYLRFLRTVNDKAPTVILGIFPDNIVRNVNQYRPFIGFRLEPFWIKGRFVLDGNQKLQWIAPPQLDAKSYIELHQKPHAFLPQEYLLPDTHDGPVTIRFPYTLTLMRFAMAQRIWNRLRGQTPWNQFYRPDHASGAVPLTIAIARSFVQEAERRGSRVLIIMMPSAGSFRSLERFGTSDYSPFVTAMTAVGLNVFDPLPALVKALEGQSYCKLFAQETTCQGHYGIAGGSILARIVAEKLEDSDAFRSIESPK